jgi:hypothetical protein
MALLAGGGLKLDHDRIEIAVLFQAGVDQATANGRHLDRLLAQQEARSTGR